MKKWKEGDCEAGFGFEESNPTLKAKRVSDAGGKESCRGQTSIIGCDAAALRTLAITSGPFQQGGGEGR